ncbi:MAG: RdgB/HAM1 family non-canonical purine NTP pyrophosphatase [Candidatus Neomarinimicrobiota bacterium]
MKIVLATHNYDKEIELQHSLQGLGVKICSLSEYPDIGEIEETGTTLLENSLLKAHTVYDRTGLPAIADDTGLEVDALDGAPGVYSARFSGADATYEDNVNKLLSVMEDVSDDMRSARFRTVISFVDEVQELWTEGFIEGRITRDPRGNMGFGYDPIFYIPRLEKTFAELSTAEKNKISHRGLALQKLRKILINVLK